MQYHIVGAKRDTGEDVDIVLDAATPSGAEEQANQLNIMVEKLEPTPPTTSQILPIAIPPAIQTIEKTGKGWKGLMLLCVFCMGLGVLALCAGDSSGTGVMLIMVGLVVYILASIGAWWEHG
jgi:hypothetical protein